ncbi:MAG: DNA polymerase IV, partial [Proteobacteria bacterium]|nr:DNA polymerase IV [Pseudomonadota bacterium]
MDAFYAAVERLDQPQLAGAPIIVGGGKRGVVAAASYEARRFGVRSAMPMSRALRLCPGLIVISQHWSNYGEMSDKVMERLRSLAPLVEQVS